MVFVKRRTGTKAKWCRLCRARPRANGYTVCRHAGRCLIAYNTERQEKLRLRAAASAGVMTRAQRKASQMEIDGDEIQKTAIDGLVKVFDVPENLFPNNYPVLKHDDLSVRQFVVDIDDDNARGCRDYLECLVKKLDGVKSAVANTGYFVGSLGKSFRGHRWRTSPGIIHRDTMKKTAVSFTCLLFLEDYRSSPVRIWMGSHEFLPGGTLEGELKKNFNQVLNKKFIPRDVTPKKGQCLAFDSRLIHRSLVHDDAKHRLVYSFSVAVNSNKRSHNHTDRSKEWVSRNNYDWEK